MLQRRHLLLGAGALRAQPATLHTSEEWDKPFLYPLRTVSGRNLARRYPVEPSTGENTDHAWHRGLWWGHGIINGHDFWRELGRDKTSRLVRTPEKDRFAMVTPAGERIGTNLQRYTVKDDGAFRYIDALIQVIPGPERALTFGDTDDGGFAFRLNDAFREDRGARLMNADGLEGTKNIWGQSARWVDYSAAIDGTRAGVAVFDHPANLRHPTQWHARGYSLCAANPFGSRSFSKNRGPDGVYVLKPGQVLTFNYRVVIHEGPCEANRIEELYRHWSRG
ncbi:MAG: PmoA family protein [Bryobacterales bacterium]|nr:PmoA family protein [Bryobacterales bacterium]